MSVRVQLIAEAVEDLIRYSRSGKIVPFLKKLLQLEEKGEDAGLPLGKGLTGWRKIVVGDRDWRIIFTMDERKTVATVWVIGDRSDSACYEEAQRRIANLPGTDPSVDSLASVMLALSEMQRSEKRTKRSQR
ncbi:MAG TPA: type II toxin-antitoxin system RelE/ParE family toxin [Chloroflexota bacterium]|nr:type II toxin-antitoxin system RelE/ParE family toxin [Chloroflexota bacterium]